MTVNPFEVTDGLEYRADLGGIDTMGPQGYGLLMMIDFLSGAFVGCDMGTNHLQPGSRKGHLIIALSPNLFGDTETFRRSVDNRIAQLKNSRNALGTDEIRYPGERLDKVRRQSLQSGEVVIDKLCWQDTLKILDDLKIDVPS